MRCVAYTRKWCVIAPYKGYMQLMCLKKPVDAQRNMYIYFF